MKSIAILLALFAMPAFASDFEAGFSHVIVMTGDTDDLDVPLSRGFAARGELFFSPRVSAQLSATFVNPEAILYPSAPPPSDVDLGTIGLQTTAVTARWHFRTDARVAGFVGAGPALVTIGNLDDQFGDGVEADFDPELTFVAETGVRIRFRRAPRLVFELSLAYMPLTAEPNVLKTNVPLPEELSLDPITFGLGAAWRF